MRVLLDESLPRQLARELGGHSVRTVAQEDWCGVKNGELLLRARAAAFDAFVTADQSLQYQQNLKDAEILVVVLAAPTNRLPDLLPLVPALLLALESPAPGTVVRLGRK
ncbi:MAG: hypothetical protein JOZ15_10005 [Acidobacteria bacterium]|nr:hypothetical protein [Acidobacteriota bacterium]